MVKSRLKYVIFNVLNFVHVYHHFLSISVSAKPLFSIAASILRIGQILNVNFCVEIYIYI